MEEEEEAAAARARQPLLRGGGAGAAAAGDAPAPPPSAPPPSLPLTKGAAAGGLASFSFEPWDSPVQAADAEAQPAHASRRTSLLRWALLVLIAGTTALVALAVKLTSSRLAKAKFALLTSLIAWERAQRVPSGSALAVFVATSLALAAVGGVLASYVEPVSAGSGIPEIKCVLNGVNLPRVLRAKTLACKAVGNAFAVAAGLPIGAEGPLVHSGAIVAAGLTQGKSRVFGLDTRWSVMRAFRNDVEKRDFIACGAASGVAAAFGAPVGGLLFAVEESLSHFHRELVWRILLCAVVADYVLDVFLSGVNGQWGALGAGGLLSFGDFSGGQARSWAFYELPLFLAMGALGGLVGGAFNAFNRRLTTWRYGAIPTARPARRLGEVLAIAGVHSLLSFAIAAGVGVCKPAPTPDPSRPYASNLQPLYCAAGSYNDVASALMVPSEDAIKQLLHFAAPDAFSPGGLAAFFLFYTASAAITYGAAIPSGLFIPAILSGASLGRLVGLALNAAAPTAFVDAGVYALIGAAAVLGGITRMTVSLAVIILECTGNAEFAVPLMATLIAARWTGNATRTPGIYDMHIALRQVPLLPDQLPDVALGRGQLTACDVMSRGPVAALHEVDTVARIVQLLAGTTHQAFPVVFAPAMVASTRRLGVHSLAGLIQRRHLAVLLARRVFHRRRPLLPSDLVCAFRGTVPRPPASAAAGGHHDDDGGGGGDGDAAAAVAAAAVRGGAGSSLAASEPPVAPPRVGPPRPAGFFSATLPGVGGGPLAVVTRAPSAASDGGCPPAAGPVHRTVSFFMPSGDDDDNSSEHDGAGEVVAGQRGAATMPSALQSGGALRPPAPLLTPARRRAAGVATPARSPLNSTVGADTTVILARPRVPSFVSGDGAHAAATPGVRLRLPSVPSFTEDLHALMSSVVSAGATSVGGAPSLLDHHHHRGGGGGGFGGGGGGGSSADGAAHAEGGGISRSSSSSNMTVRVRLSPHATPRHHAGAPGGGSDGGEAAAPHPTAADAAAAAAAAAESAAAQPSGGVRLVSDGVQLVQMLGGGAAPSSTPPSLPPPPASAELAPMAASSSSSSLSSLWASDGAAASGWGGSTFRRAPAADEEAAAEAAGAATTPGWRDGGGDWAGGEEGDAGAPPPLLASREFDAHWPRYPDVAKLAFTPGELRAYVDLRPYCNPTPHVVHVHAPASRAFDMFRALALHHLCVVNDVYDVVGVITRHDLTVEALNRAVARKRGGE